MFLSTAKCFVAIFLQFSGLGMKVDEEYVTMIGTTRDIVNLIDHMRDQREIQIT